MVSTSCPLPLLLKYNAATQLRFGRQVLDAPYDRSPKSSILSGSRKAAPLPGEEGCAARRRFAKAAPPIAPSATRLYQLHDVYQCLWRRGRTCFCSTHPCGYVTHRPRAFLKYISDPFEAMRAKLDARRSQGAPSPEFNIFARQALDLSQITGRGSALLANSSTMGECDRRREHTSFVRRAWQLDVHCGVLLFLNATWNNSGRSTSL